MKATFQNVSTWAAILCCSFNVACGPEVIVQNDSDAGTAHMSEEPPVATWPVSLNAGEKWEMDGHTRKSINRMNQLINGDETVTLGKSLAGEFHDLMQGCTMQGEPHNQLHVFLNELMPEILALSSDQSDEGIKGEREKIRKLLQEYNLYFE